MVCACLARLWYHSFMAVLKVWAVIFWHNESMDKPAASSASLLVVPAMFSCGAAHAVQDREIDGSRKSAGKID